MAVVTTAPPGDQPATRPGTHPGEPALHAGDVSARLNWLRAGVLGANDGIVSVAGIVLGVVAATGSREVLLTAGTAGLVAGALSMAVGEYVSVSTQRDTQRALLEKEQRELAEMPEEELAELAGLYEDKGLSPELARRVAEELTAAAPLRAHAEAELGIDPDEVARPWQAAWASMLAFTLGALLPLVAVLLPAQQWRAGPCAVAGLVALGASGPVRGRVGGPAALPAPVRTGLGGAAALGVTYAIGSFVGMAV